MGCRRLAGPVTHTGASNILNVIEVIELLIVFMPNFTQ